jgi:hypothetical protein
LVYAPEIFLENLENTLKNYKDLTLKFTKWVKFNQNLTTLIYFLLQSLVCYIKIYYFYLHL